MIECQADLNLLAYILKDFNLSAQLISPGVEVLHRLKILCPAEGGTCSLCRNKISGFKSPPIKNDGQGKVAAAVANWTMKGGFKKA